MPKLKTSADDQRNLMLRAQIRRNMTLYGVSSVRELADRVGISPPSMYARLRDPEKLTIRDLRRLAAVLHFSEDERKIIF